MLPAVCKLHSPAACLPKANCFTVRKHLLEWAPWSSHGIGEKLQADADARRAYDDKFIEKTTLTGMFYCLDSLCTNLAVIAREQTKVRELNAHMHNRVRLLYVPCLEQKRL